MISAARVSARDDHSGEDVAKKLESLTMDTPPEGAMSKQKADQRDDVIGHNAGQEKKSAGDEVTNDLPEGRDALTNNDVVDTTKMEKATKTKSSKRRKKPIGILWPRDKERKQSVFMNKFVHDGKEYTVTTEALKGGKDFLLSDRITVRDLSEPRKLLSPSEIAEMENLLHNQCSFGELDTVSHLIEDKGVNPSALDKV